MRTLLGLAAILLFGLGGLAGPAAGAGAGLSAADRASIRSVIEQQLSAFQSDDGNRAFGFASPDIHRMFQTPDRFMDMVRTGYLPV